ncbi:hypothetical protein IFM89_010120 [Coptis chinensis]|uniref:Protein DETOXIFICATION n=1 Tax=Coptis chinensis TaxID=261450 RepID=A0A835LV45_9MAGN|nr:hypothetical protein IFM89_010120 [Coptis chinensis]
MTMNVVTSGMGTKLVNGMTCSYGGGGSSKVYSWQSMLNMRRTYTANCHLFANHSKLLIRKRAFHVISSRVGSDYSVGQYDVKESSDAEEEFDTLELVEIPSTPQSVKKELIALSLPAIGGQAVEPLSQLMETAFIGRLGPVELASAGVSISIFNIISKLFNIPLLSIATSFVAEDIAKSGSMGSASDGGLKEESHNGRPVDEMTERKQLPSVSTALLLAVGIGIFEALALYLGSGLFLNVMGITSASSMRIPSQQFLKLRALGAPAVVVSLALQGVFRGFKDTKTPLFCLGKFELPSQIIIDQTLYEH